MSQPLRIAIIGAGNIGSALLGGILKAGVTTPENVHATVKTAEHANDLARNYAAQITAGKNLAAVQNADVVILAVKASVMRGVLEEIRWGLRDDRILISVAATFPISAIEAQIGRQMPIFRAMPNIPVIVGEGATCIAHNDLVSPQQRAVVEAIFGAVGIVCFIDEDQLHAATALSGSGPAYVYMVIESLINGGLKMGLSHEVATRLAEQTVLGAAKLVRDTMLHPAILKDQVITPGGVTI